MSLINLKIELANLKIKLTNAKMKKNNDVEVQYIQAQIELKEQEIAKLKK
jgi:hypothetical protein